MFLLCRARGFRQDYHRRLRGSAMTTWKPKPSHRDGRRHTPTSLHHHFLPDSTRGLLRSAIPKNSSATRQKKEKEQARKRCHAPPTWLVLRHFPARIVEGCHKSLPRCRLVVAASIRPCACALMASSAFASETPDCSGLRARGTDDPPPKTQRRVCHITAEYNASGLLHRLARVIGHVHASKRGLSRERVHAAGRYCKHHGTRYEDHRIGVSGSS